MILLADAMLVSIMCQRHVFTVPCVADVCMSMVFVPLAYAMDLLAKAEAAKLASTSGQQRRIMVACVSTAIILHARVYQESRANLVIFLKMQQGNNVGSALVRHENSNICMCAKN